MQSFEAKEVTSPIPQAFSCLVLSNLTNQTTPTLSPNSQKSAPPTNKIESPHKIQSSLQLNKGPNLQQENHQLKSQIEVLKQALIGICKDPKMSQQLGPLIQSVQNENIESELFNFISGFQQQQQQTPTRAVSPKKAQPKQSRDTNSTAFLPYTDNIDKSPAVKTLQCDSSKKNQASSNRRRRCDRVNTPSNQNTSTALNQYSVNYIESKFTVTPTSSNSRCIIKEIPLRLCDSKLKLRLDEENTSRIIEYEMQDSRMNQSPSVQADEMVSFLNESLMHQTQNPSMNRDSSQIQLKYAKMLEELENQSVDRVKVENKIDETEGENETQSYLNENLYTPQKDEYSLQTYSENCQGSITQENRRTLSSGCSKAFHLRNKKSSQFEQKQFYEQELNALKTELEQFAKEEEQLLSILQSSRKPEVIVEAQNSQCEMSTQEEGCEQEEANVEEIKEEEEGGKKEEEVTQEIVKGKVPEHLRSCSFSGDQNYFGEQEEEKNLNQSLSVIPQEKTEPISLRISQQKQQTLSQEELLQNLAEANQFIEQVNQEEESIEFIKPVKILSPSSKDLPLEEEPLRTEPKAIVQFQTSQQDEQFERQSVAKQNKTPKTMKRGFQQITPIRQQVEQTTSADRHLKKSSTHKQKESISKMSEQQPSKTVSLIPVDSKPSHAKTNSGNSISMARRNQRAFISQQKQRPVTEYIPVHSQSKSKLSRVELRNGKSPNQYSNYQIFKTMSNNQSPVKQILKSERRYKQESTQEEHEEEGTYEEENCNREQKLLSLEQLSKRQSLAKGLRQQELPVSDDDCAEQNLKGKEKKLPVQSKQTEKEDLFNSGNYFGLYSKEQSEELKNQRYESIKKAEQLLSEFIVQKSQRPYFMDNILTRPLQIQSPPNEQEQLYQQVMHEEQIQLRNQPVRPIKYISDSSKLIEEDYKTYIVEDINFRIIEESNYRQSHHLFDENMFNNQTSSLQESKAGPLSHNPNEISFQNQELCQVSFVRNSVKNSLGHSRSSSRQQTTFLNIEIPALIRSPKKEVVMEELKEGLEEYESKSVTIVHEENEDQRSKTIAQEDQSDNELNQQPTPQKRNSTLSQKSSQFIYGRRKSHELCKSRAVGLLSQQKKSTMMKKKKLDDQASPVATTSAQIQLNQTSSHTAFQKFNMGANSQEKNSKSHYNRNGGDLMFRGADINSFMMGQIVQRHFNNTYIDPEFLYEKRSKSVIKRRDELIKKKEEQNRSRIEAKYQKIDSIRQTRNQKLSGVVHGARSLNKDGSKHPRQQSRGKFCEQSSYFNQQQDGTIDDEQYLEIRAGGLEKTLGEANYSSSKDQNSLVVDAQKHLQNPKLLHSCEKKSEFKASIGLTTPISMQPTSQTLQNPSFQTTNCKTSLLMSECSSFRQPTESQKQTIHAVTNSKSLSKIPACNMAYKKQQQQQVSQQALKQSIVNRTLRMGQTVTQSKGRQVQPQLDSSSSSFMKKMQSTIEISAYTDVHGKTQNPLDKNSTLNSTLQGSQSFINHKVNSQISNSSQNQQNKAIVNSKKYVMKPRDSRKLNSSRSNRNANDAYKQEGNTYYNSKKTNVSNTSSNAAIICQEQFIAVDSSICNNCQRLIGKGLSTDFCLQHVGTPKVYE